MTRRVLVTGGLGYLGGRISQQLAKTKQYSVIIGTQRKDLRLPDSLDGCSLVTVDLNDSTSLAEVCKDVDAVVHLAALNEIDCAADPIRSVEVNGIGTLRLLRAAEVAAVKRFVYFSTAHVYGAPLRGTINERTLPRPTHPYAISHRTAEDFVIAAHDRKSITGIVIRLSNGFGAPLVADVNRWTLVVNDLCRQAVETGQLKLLSSGLQRRDFITLEDVGRGVAHILGLTELECGDGVFNLGGEHVVSIIEMTELIASRCSVVLGFTPQIVRPIPREGEQGDNLDFQIDKLKNTGFNLKGNIIDEIDATLHLCVRSFGRSTQ